MCNLFSINDWIIKYLKLNIISIIFLKNGSANDCLTCDSTIEHRTLSGSSCVCEEGYYENNSF